ncbi:histidine phosphatase family protein [Aeromicrobium camelliae]|uniref:Histidine phosphatase family protein n=1 Tax=Aeromicrobium camelliae TaxID=1538144 RepID=A0A3N6ZGL2_9ACTN|nr:histidine phosphatase family protein [Aeromicrobium camelliae]RQN09251.1 histidine phosphatase family protein [Aeromicrobium camelliae]
MGVLHLIRHGQASFGSDDYDVLSPLGHTQASAIGQAWEAAEFQPTDAIAGSMRRHSETAINAIDACGGPDGYDVDAGWNEYDHIGIATAHDEGALALDTKAFQAVLNEALARWREGVGEFDEPYAGFQKRVLAAFERAVAVAGPGRQVAVFSSGGPIAMAVSHVLVGDDSLFQRLNDVLVNASITTILCGTSGPRLLSFNEHTHLPRDLVTYR